MSTQVQYRRGTATENNAFTGALAEITVDTTNGTLRVHDGITVGGSNIATVSYVTSQISSLSSNSITDGTSNVKVFNNGNVATTVGGTANVLLVTSTGAVVTGTLSATGNIIGGNIVNSNANGVGNIGSSTTYFNTVFAKATSAQYADLAEMYCADDIYVPGTVVEFGGSEEITISTASHSTRIAGIISTNPSYLMNSALDCTNALEVALVGRVPCQVVGTICKGDRLVSSVLPGVATALDIEHYEPGCIIGKALENYDSVATGVIEVAVGRI